MKQLLLNSKKKFKQGSKVLLAAFLLLSFLQMKAQTPSAAASDATAQQLSVGACAPNLAYNDATVNDPSATNCGSIVRDAWLWFDATSTKTSICFFNGSSRNAAIYVYTGMPGSLTEVACANDMGNGKNEMLILNSTSGTRYRLRIAKVGGGPQTLTGDVCVFNTPANDDCATAIALTVNSSCVSIQGTTQGATQSANAASCGGKSDDDVWYSFVATATDATIALTNASVGFNPVLDLRSGACNGTTITCSDVSNTNGNEIINATGLTIGQTYYLRVYGFAEASYSATGTFNICVTDLCAAIVSYNVTGGGSICQGSPGLAVGLSNSDLGFNYQLKLNGSNIGSPMAGTGSALSFGLQSTAGNYTVEASTLGTPACTFMMNGSVNIFVSTTPPYQYIGSVTASAATACNGSSFTATVQPVSGATEYIWSAPSGSSINGILLTGITTTVSSTSTTVSIITGNPQGAGYYIYVYAKNGCGQTSNTKATWVQGTLSTPPISSGNKSVCTSSNPTDVETYTVTAVTGADDYKWTVTTSSGTAANIVGSDTLSSVTIHYPTGFVSGSVSVIARMNCGYVSGSRSINISTSPAIPGAISGSEAICPASSSTYKIGLINGSASVTWSLPAGASLVSSGRNATHDTAVVQFPAPYSSGTICVTPYTSCGQAGITRCKSVYAAIPAVPSSVSGPLTGACNQIFQYSITPSNILYADQYEWSLNGNVVNGQTGNTANIALASGGTVCVRGINNSCVAPNNAGKQRCISVSAGPGNLGSIAGPSSVCQGQTYTFSVSPQAGLAYAWTVPSGCSIVINNGNSISVQWNITSGGVVNVTANNGCANSYTSVLNVSYSSCRIASNEKVISDTKLNAYPNPATDQVTVSFASSSKENSTIQLMDLTGRIIMNFKVQLEEGQNEISLNLAETAKGIYLLRLETDSQLEKTMKIIVK